MCEWKQLGTLRLGRLNMFNMGYPQMIMKLVLDSDDLG